MSLRIDVLEDETIEILRTRENRRPKRYYFATLDSAVSSIRFLIKQDLAKARQEKYEYEVVREGRKAFKQIEEKSPYGSTKR